MASILLSGFYCDLILLLASHGCQLRVSSVLFWTVLCASPSFFCVVLILLLVLSSSFSFLLFVFSLLLLLVLSWFFSPFPSSRYSSYRRAPLCSQRCLPLLSPSSSCSGVVGCGARAYWLYGGRVLSLMLRVWVRPSALLAFLVPTTSFFFAFFPCYRLSPAVCFVSA